MSLRGRLLIAVGAVALVALGAADVATYSALRSFLFSRVDQTLQTTSSAVERAVNGPPGGTTNEAPRLPDSLMSLAPGTFVEVRTAAGEPVSGQIQPAALPGGKEYQPKLPVDIPGLTDLGAGSAAVFFTADSEQKGGPQFRVRASLLPSGKQLIVAVPLADTVGTLHRLLAIELGVTAAALVAAGLLGWWLVRIGLRPLRDVERTADAIAAGELEQRVPGETSRTEVGRLAAALNVMLNRIEGAFAERDATEAELRESEERLRRFVADASHELRTPLAAVSAYAELLERGTIVREADLERVMGGIRIETARMGTLVEDLLLLARLDEGRPLAKEPVELVALASEAVQTARTVGTAWPVHLEAQRPVEVVGDRDRLRQVLGNLLANVRTHTPPGTSAAVRLFALDGNAVIEVVDDGPGLTGEQPTRVFERFYRADQSRRRTHASAGKADEARASEDHDSRIPGGSGLGLSIVAAIVAAHGGQVSAGNAPTGGAVFTVRLPLAEAPAEPEGVPSSL